MPTNPPPRPSPSPPPISLPGPPWAGPESTSPTQKMPSRSSSMVTRSKSPRDSLCCRPVRSPALTSLGSATTAGYRSLVIAGCVSLKLRSRRSPSPLVPCLLCLVRIPFYSPLPVFWLAVPCFWKFPYVDFLHSQFWLYYLGIFRFLWSMIKASKLYPMVYEKFTPCQISNLIRIWSYCDYWEDAYVLVFSLGRRFFYIFAK